MRCLLFNNQDNSTNAHPSLPAVAYTRVLSLPSRQLNRGRRNLGCKHTWSAGLKWALQGCQTPTDSSYREMPSTPGILLEPAGVAQASNSHCKPLVLQSLAWQMWCGIIRDHVLPAGGEQVTPRQWRAKAGKHRATPSQPVSLKERHPQPLYKLLIRHLTS